MKPGDRYKSAVCSTELVVIRVPSLPAGELSCGGVSMALLGEDISGGEPLSGPQSGHAAVGKRYVDPDSGLEVLCSKAGFGALAYDGRPLSLKSAKPLPASD